MGALQWRCWSPSCTTATNKSNYLPNPIIRRTFRCLWNKSPLILGQSSPFSDWESCFSAAHGSIWASGGSTASRLLLPAMQNTSHPPLRLCHYTRPPFSCRTLSKSRKLMVIIIVHKGTDSVLSTYIYVSLFLITIQWSWSFYRYI